MKDMNDKNTSNILLIELNMLKFEWFNMLNGAGQLKCQKVHRIIIRTKIKYSRS